MGMDENMEDQRAIELSGIDIDACLNAYLECQLWASHDELAPSADNDLPVEIEGVDRSEHSECLDGFYGVDDIDHGYVDDVREEIEAFVSSHPLAVRLYLNASGDRNGYDRSGLFGYDLFLTREGHGAGFWDRGLGELGDYLTDRSQELGEASMLTDGALCSLDGRTFDAGTLYA